MHQLSAVDEYASFRRRYDAENQHRQEGEVFVFAPWTGQFWTLIPSHLGLVSRVGYHFSQGRIVIGIGYDLDGDDDSRTSKELNTRRFDGAFGRLVLTW